MNIERNTVQQALDALEEIALAGMSGSGQESEEGMRDWHARQAWKFIGIAARALEPLREALAAPQPAHRPVMDLVDKYWELAYAEGKEGRNHDTKNGDAQLTRHLIQQALSTDTAEPVAWMYPDFHGQTLLTFHRQDGLTTEVPLYTTPQLTQRDPASITTIYAAQYNDCIHESGYETLSLHATPQAAQDAVVKHHNIEKATFAEWTSAAIADGADPDSYKWDEYNGDGSQRWMVYEYQIQTSAAEEIKHKRAAGPWLAHTHMDRPQGLRTDR